MWEHRAYQVHFKYIHNGHISARHKVLPDSIVGIRRGSEGVASVAEADTACLVRCPDLQKLARSLPSVIALTLLISGPSCPAVQS